VVPSWRPNGEDYNYQCCRGPDGACVPGSTTLPWYDDDGTPHVDTHRFPDMKGMVDKAHSQGLRAGWYFGNYQCANANGHHSWNMTRLVEGSVSAITRYGFDSVKLDSGFPVARNVSLWAELLNASGRPVMIENCHQGAEGPGMSDPDAGRCTGLGSPSDCPYNFWRTTGDPEPDWRTIMRELNSLRRVVNRNYDGGKHAGAPEYNADPPLTRPGGWAYPGTMVVGDGRLTESENRVHFGAWCIISSPLILAYNLTDPDRRESVWDIVTNKEAIQVNQIWAGHPGSQAMAGLGSNGAVELWTKPLGEGRLAALLVNTEDLRGGGGAPAPPPDSKLGLEKCAGGHRGQQWKVKRGNTSEIATVQSALTGNCWEVRACSIQDHAQVDTCCACKPLPKPDAGGCDLNMAWALHANGTITSVLGHRCLTARGWGVEVAGCDGSPAQRWSVDAAGGADGLFTVREAGTDGRCLAEVDPASTAVTIDLADLNITGTTKVRDVWAKRDLPDASGSVAAEVGYHGSVFLVFTPPGTDWPIPFKLAPWMDHPAASAGAPAEAFI